MEKRMGLRERVYPSHISYGFSRLNIDFNYRKAWDISTWQLKQ